MLNINFRDVSSAKTFAPEFFFPNVSRVRVPLSDPDDARFRSNRQVCRGQEQAHDSVSLVRTDYQSQPAALKSSGNVKVTSR